LILFVRIKSVQRAIDSRHEKILRAGNPFTPMSGKPPLIFGGRTKELEFFEQKLFKAINLNQREHFLVLGDWGIGKSTLLTEYKKLCQSRGYITSIVTLECLQSGTTTIEAATSLMEAIARGLPYPRDQFKKLREIFESIDVSFLGLKIKLTPNPKPNSKISPQTFLHDALTSLWQDIQGKTDILVILIDELENFMTVPEIIMTLKSTLSSDSFNSVKILIGLASTKESWSSFTNSDKHHPLRRYFLSQVELKPLNQEEVLTTISSLLVGSGISFDPKIIQQIFEHTKGHPFEMQLLGSHLFDNQLSGKVTDEVWEKSLQDTLSKLGSAVFERWLDGVNSEEGKILVYITQLGKEVSDREIQAFIQQNSPGNFSENAEKYLQSLVEKRLLCKRLGIYTIVDPMLGAYIKNYFD
jgi:AAA ATPase domain